MSELTIQDVAVLLLSLGILLLFARAFGELAVRIGIAAIIGELVAGIILGPTVFGLFMPDLQAFLFPVEGPRAVVLDGLINLSVVLFLLVVGMEIDVSTVWRQGRRVLAIATGAIVVPFALAFAFALLLPGLLQSGMGPETAVFIFALFFGASLTITGSPILSKTLIDLGIYQTDFGMIVISVAVIVDLVCWILFGFILGLVGASAGVMGSHGIYVAIVFVVLMLTVGRWVIHRILPWVQAHTSWPGGVLGFALAACLLSAAFTHAIGIHAVVGAFLLGVAIGDSSHLREQTRTVISQFVSFIFVPLFFASVSLHIDFINQFDPVLVSIVLVLTGLGKLIGAGWGARFTGMSWREGWAMGLGVNAGGSMEVVLGTLGVSYGIISNQMFGALIVTAVASAFVPALALRYVLARPKTVRIVDLMSSKAYVPALEATDRWTAIRELARAAGPALNVDSEMIYEAVAEREIMMPTGIGNGVAIPHGRLDGISRPFIAVGFSPHGLDFNAPDGHEVHVVFLILTPQEAGSVQLEILSGISRMCRNPAFVEHIMRAGSFTEFLAHVRVAEAEQG